jgi:hypothetical protein
MRSCRNANTRPTRTAKAQATTPSTVRFVSQAKALVLDLNEARDRFRAGAEALLASRPAPDGSSDLEPRETVEGFARETLARILAATQPGEAAEVFIPWQVNGGEVTAANLRAEGNATRSRARAEAAETSRRRKAEALERKAEARKVGRVLRALGDDLPGDPAVRELLERTVKLVIRGGRRPARPADLRTAGPILDVRDALPVA